MPGVMYSAKLPATTSRTGVGVGGVTIDARGRRSDLGGGRSSGPGSTWAGPGAGGGSIGHGQRGAEDVDAVVVPEDGAGGVEDVVVGGGDVVVPDDGVGGVASAVVVVGIVVVGVVVVGVVVVGDVVVGVVVIGGCVSATRGVTGSCARAGADAARLAAHTTHRQRRPITRA